MARFVLTDFEWSVIQPLLPTKVRGVKRADDRKVLNGIFWRLRTGAPGPIFRRDMARPRPA
jgi:transposase